MNSSDDTPNIRISRGYMTILATIIIGFIVGLLARFLMPGRDPGGFIVTTLIGIVGAFIGSWVGRAVGLYAPGEPAGFFMSLIGALILLFAYRAIAGRRAEA
jgi:uncharacterized membrane protein YeaQ/YmgE (transglycosylase-associated protein family)